MSVRSDDAALGGRRFSLRMGLGGIAPDPWIEDGEGRRIFQVDEMARARLDSFILRDLHGREVAKLQASVSAPDATVIEREGATVATVRRYRAGLRHRFVIDVVGEVLLEIHGHVGRHEYEIRRGADVVATVSRGGSGGTTAMAWRWAQVRMRPSSWPRPWPSGTSRTRETVPSGVDRSSPTSMGGIRPSWRWPRASRNTGQ